jgi:phage terminase large subunit GpA-like protein
VLVVKGQETGAALVGVPSAVDVAGSGKKIRRGVKVWPVNVSMAKSELYGFLRLERGDEPEPPAGWVHVPPMDDEYYKQLTAEQFVTRVVKGYRKGEWQKTRERNEALDCRNYARAAAASVGLDRFGESDFLALEAHIRNRPAPPRTPPLVEDVTPPPAQPQNRAGWVSRRQGGWFSR